MQYGELYHTNYYKEVQVKNKGNYISIHYLKALGALKNGES
jgi:hypothetical protein